MGTIGVGLSTLALAAGSVVCSAADAPTAPIERPADHKYFIGLVGNPSVPDISWNAIFMFIVSTMLFPGVLTLVPSFLLVKQLGLLNTYWAMILPFIAGGQVFAIFVFRAFFSGLPEDLFEAARIDGAGHVRMYWNIVVPMSKPVFSVVLVMNVLGTWNSFLWPFIVNPDGEHHMVASGLFVMANSAYASDFATMYSAYTLASIPLLILLCLATSS